VSKERGGCLAAAMNPCLWRNGTETDSADDVIQNEGFSFPKRTRWMCNVPIGKPGSQT